MNNQSDSCCFKQSNDYRHNFETLNIALNTECKKPTTRDTFPPLHTNRQQKYVYSNLRLFKCSKKKFT